MSKEKRKGSAIQWLLIAGLVCVAAIGGLAAIGNSLSGMLISEAQGACLMSYCKTPATHKITNEHRQIIGDVYDPGHGRPLQLRNNSRQILGYIQADGTVRNTRGQRVLEIEVLERSD